MEYCDLYDRDGQPTGQVIVRGDAIPEGCYRMIAGVLCVHTDGSILLMKRHPSKRTHPGLFEASASGSVMAGETAQAAAVRELREETGFVAHKLTELGIYYGSPAIMGEKIWMYLAEDLHKEEQDLDEDEFLEVFSLPLEEAVELVLNGTITDGKTQAGILKAWARKKK